MANEIIRVVARVVATPEKVEELRGLLLGLVEPTRAETGCVHYELLQNQTNPAEFVFMEQWDGAEALNNHLASPHILDALGKVGTFTVSPPEIHQYVLLSQEA